MVRVAKRTIKGKTYYYLEHSMREKRGRATRSRYLGNKMPKNADRAIEEFTLELDREKWFDRFEQIKRNIPPS